MKKMNKSTNKRRKSAYNQLFDFTRHLESKELIENFIVKVYCYGFKKAYEQMKHHFKGKIDVTFKGNKVYTKGGRK